MADGRPRRFALRVHLDYTFDRLRAPKLAQVYELLVPMQQRLVGADVRKEVVHEDGGDLRSSVLAAAARRATIWKFRRSGSSKTKAIAVRHSSGQVLSEFGTLLQRVRFKLCSPMRPTV
jgi:hypothetical protein